MRRPRIGFLGTGWIGRHRMAAMLETGAVEAIGICDSADTCAGEAMALAPGAVRASSLEALLDLGLDGVVIATPSALHAVQAIQCLDRGVAVFCQKPLGRSALETGNVVAAARAADRLLGVDLSYRHVEGMRRIAGLIGSGALGRIFAIDLIFHNAYGPDKPWFYDPELSGGGCVIDLGVHLIDLALWTLGFPPASKVTASLFAAGNSLSGDRAEVEDYASASFMLDNAVDVRLACSWRLNAGQSAIIEASFYGTEGGASLRNIDGSFYELQAERFDGTAAEVLADGSDSWGGRAAAAWAVRLAGDSAYDPSADEFVRVAAVIDAIYAGQQHPAPRNR